MIILPISAGIACDLSLGNKVLHKGIINKYNKYKKQYEKDQQTIKSLDKFYRKSLQDNLTDRNEYASLSFLLDFRMKKKCFFYKHGHKNRIKFF